MKDGLECNLLEPNPDRSEENACNVDFGPATIFEISGHFGAFNNAEFGGAWNCPKCVTAGIRTTEKADFTQTIIQEHVSDRKPTHSEK